MSHSILLVVPMPDEKNEVACQLWHNLLNDIAQITKEYKGIQLLGRNVMLIDVDNNLNELSVVVSQLHEWDYKYAILDEEMIWHEVVNKS